MQTAEAYTRGIHTHIRSEETQREREKDAATAPSVGQLDFDVVTALIFKLIFLFRFNRNLARLLE